jgi:gamma-glutamyltranspeptidase/glutathione hydrolase
MSNFSRQQIIRKPAVVSEHGIVASQHRRASEVGARVLAEGGNAVDAAVATSFALGVLEPWMSGPGGGGFMVVRMAGENQARVVDFAMRSPQGLNPADYPLSGEQGSDIFPWPAVVDDRNALGATAVAVPGVVAGMALALDTFGTMDWGRLVEPAARCAEEGLLVDWWAQLVIAAGARDLSRFPKSRETFLDPEGYPKGAAWSPIEPERCDLSAMAATLRTLAAEGPRAFYEGRIGEAVVRDVREAGGCLSEQDLRDYRAQVYDAAEVGHPEGRIFVTPELTAGPTFQRVAELVGRTAVTGARPGAEAYVAYAEALSTAYEERLRDMGDVDGRRGAGCTTHFAVVDRDGNLVSVTQTLLALFGSRLMLPEAGFLMNNGLLWFDPEPGKPNSLGPDKRPLNNMCPVIGERSDGFGFALGACGGRRILPAVFQLASFVLDFGMALEEAFHTPRIDVSGSDPVVADEDLPSAVHEALAARFQHVTAPRTVLPFYFACPSAVGRDAGRRNTGVTEVMSPWSDAVAEDAAF